MRRSLALVLCLVAAGCGGKGTGPSPPTSAGGTSTVVPSTTTAVPKVTAEAIAGLDAGAVHAALEKTGFTKAAPTGSTGFTTTTSKRADATVSTYGKGPTDVVKIVAEADTAVAPAVFGTVVAAVLGPAEAKKADTWLRGELKRGPLNKGAPRTATATYAKVPYDLLVNAGTATLSIGRLTS